MPEPQFTHILQKTGILKNFSIVKTLTLQELENIKKKIRSTTKTEEEFRTTLQNVLAQYGNMHDKNNLVPGIIYTKTNGVHPNKAEELDKIVDEVADTLSRDDFTSLELAYIVRGLIDELGITREDFEELNEASENEEDSPPEGEESYDDDGLDDDQI